MVTHFGFLKNVLKSFMKNVYFHSACHDNVYNLNILYFGHDSRQFINKLQTFSTLNLN